MQKVRCLAKGTAPFTPSDLFVSTTLIQKHSKHEICHCRQISYTIFITERMRRQETKCKKIIFFEVYENRNLLRCYRIMIW